MTAFSRLLLLLCLILGNAVQLIADKIIVEPHSINDAITTTKNIRGRQQQEESVTIEKNAFIRLLYSNNENDVEPLSPNEAHRDALRMKKKFDAAKMLTARSNYGLPTIVQVEIVFHLIEDRGRDGRLRWRSRLDSDVLNSITMTTTFLFAKKPYHFEQPTGPFQSIIILA